MVGESTATGRRKGDEEEGSHEIQEGGEEEAVHQLVNEGDEEEGRLRQP